MMMMIIILIIFLFYLTLNPKFRGDKKFKQMYFPYVCSYIHTYLYAYIFHIRFVFKWLFVCISLFSSLQFVVIVTYYHHLFLI